MCNPNIASYLHLLMFSSLWQVERWMEKLEESDTKRKIYIKTSIVSVSLSVSCNPFDFSSVEIISITDSFFFFSFFFRLDICGMNIFTSLTKLSIISSTHIHHGFPSRAYENFLKFQIDELRPFKWIITTIVFTSSVYICLRNFTQQLRNSSLTLFAWVAFFCS